ncbi:MAG: diacylglycerol kinase family lipid kinase [Alphaproteobacteria bacterium]|nr:diacylglycerol kinase family lipid kinase [Alphaproteobacteria bacterium]
MAFVRWESVPSQMNAGAYTTSVNKSEPLCLVVNPRAGAGRAGARVAELQRAAARAFAHVDIRLTEAPGHGAELARAAVDEGYGIVAAVGGDGTCHEVVQGMVDEAGRPRSNRCAFTTIPFGTGSDLQRSLRMPRNLGEALWVAATGITLPTDLGEVRWPDGTAERFVNVAGFGANGEVVRHANQMDKRMGGRATFLLATARTARTFRGGPLRLRWTGPRGPGSWEGEVMAGFVANGGWCGGGMHVGPDGTMHDGLLDLTLLPPMSPARQLRHARRLYDGSIARTPGVVHLQVETLEVDQLSQAPFPLDLDGEERPGLPARFAVLPAAVQVRGGWLDNPVRGDRGRDLR